MVLADSHEIPRAPCYSGHAPKEAAMFHLRGLTHYAGPSQALRLHHDFLTPRPVVAQSRTLPQPPHRNPYQVSHDAGLASSAFARHYSRNHMLFSLPVGTEMFHFPTFPPHTLYIQMRVTAHDDGRFPHSDTLGSTFVANSPRLNAGSHVLHRLLMPRHPPCALTHLPTTHHPPPHTPKGRDSSSVRVHNACNKHKRTTKTHHTTKTTATTPPRKMKQRPEPQ